jgi:hypothetical protein
VERLGEVQVLTTAQAEEDFGGIDEQVAARVLLPPDGGLACGDTARNDDRDRLSFGGER